MIYLIPLYLCITSRLQGGGIINNIPRILRDFLYAIPYGLIFYPNYYHAIAAFILAYVGKNIGHENFWYMAIQPTDIQRPASPIAYVILKMGFKFDTITFCTLGMSTKGIIISAGTTSPIIILSHAIIFPMSYYISFKFFKTNVVAEYMTGFLCVLSLILV